MALEYIKPGVHRYQARDKRWVELEWKGRTVVVRRPEGSTEKTFRTPDEARAWLVRFDRSMHNKLFSRVTRIVPAGRLAKPTLPKAERRRAARELARTIEQRPSAPTVKPSRPSARAGDGRAAWLELVALKTRLARVPGLRVRARFGKPATAAMLARCERTLGIRLPPSLRTFLGECNGAAVSWSGAIGEAAIEILGTSELARAYRRARTWPGDAPEHALLSALRPIEPFYGDIFVALDARKASPAGEMAVVAFGRPHRARDWVVLAPDFAAFVRRRVRDALVLRGVGDVAEKRIGAIRAALAQSART